MTLQTGLATNWTGVSSQQRCWLSQQRRCGCYWCGCCFLLTALNRVVCSSSILDYPCTETERSITPRRRGCEIPTMLFGTVPTPSCSAPSNVLLQRTGNLALEIDPGDVASCATCVSPPPTHPQGVIPQAPETFASQTVPCFVCTVFRLLQRRGDARTAIPHLVYRTVALNTFLCLCSKQAARSTKILPSPLLVMWRPIPMGTSFYRVIIHTTNRSHAGHRTHPTDFQGSIDFSTSKERNLNPNPPFVFGNGPSQFWSNHGL